MTKAGIGTWSTQQPMDLKDRTSTFVQLGRVLALFGSKAPWPGHACGLNEAEYLQFDRTIAGAHHLNGWYTEGEVRHALLGLAHLLDAERMDHWLATYPKLGEDRSPRTVGLILAGNVPLVGFHDLLCTLLSGHRARVKCSSQDAGLTAGVVELLQRFSPELHARVELVEGRLGTVDAVIATGSNNTARYFEHYFAHVPRIVRKSRVSVSVLDGSETDAELAALSEDVFRYFGLGCRNVSKLFIPQHFDMDRVFRALFPWKDIVLHGKYANNYDYYRALWLLDREPFLEHGFLIVKETAALASPVSVLYVERYSEGLELKARLDAEANSIQCIVGHAYLPFGTAQQPGPEDYADGVDTLAFLLEL
ncbi:MAG: acyl-CoA reductase [Flavobacteriales bacterium]|nr:acyl-CoA reductase [Flavobacteriales bacterium]